MIKDYFKIEKNPKKGLLPLEWVMLGYMAVTVITMLFTYTKLVNPEEMLWGRLRVLAMTAALWAVYRMAPCRITKMVRIIAQIALLAWWYPACPALCQGNAMGGSKRTDVDGLLHVLSDDSSNRTLLFFLQIL